MKEVLEESKSEEIQAVVEAVTDKTMEKVITVKHFIEFDEDCQVKSPTMKKAFRLATVKSNRK